MPSIIACECDVYDLFLRMHFLREMRGRDEERLSELWWGTGVPSAAE